MGIIVAAVVLQFYLAGYGVFAFNGLDAFMPHFVVGDLIAIASLIGIALAFATRQPWRITILNGAFVVLMIIQFILAHTNVQAISALHIVNGVLILGLTVYLTREASMHAMRQRSSAAAPAALSAPAKS
jgi:hypothetical protein